jgi:hypothetical protein
VAPMTEIPVYQRLAESDLTLVDVPDALDHPSLVHAMEQAVGRIALEPLLPGAPLRLERLGDDARTTLLGPDDDLVLMRLDRPESWAPGRVDLVAIGDGGACLLAQDVRTHGSPEPGLLSLAMPAVAAHRTRYALTQLRIVPVSRNPIDRGRRPDLVCGGGLPASPIRLVHGAGNLLRLGQPATELVISHPDRAIADAVTPSDLWMHGLTPGHTAASLGLMAGGPPLLLDITIVDEPVAPQATEPVGGLVALPPWQVEDVRVWPEDAASVAIDAGRALVRPRHAGAFQVYTRTADGELRLHDLAAIDGWPAPARDEPVLPLRPGQRRKVTLPAAIVAAWVGDGAVASAELKGPRARIVGLARGTTRVVLMDASGETSSLRVVVP